MFRWFSVIPILIAALVVAFVIYFWAMKVSILERFLSKQLNAKVTIENVHVAWNQLTLEKLRVQNSKLFSFESTITLKVSPLGLFKQPLHIKEVDLKDSVMTIELFNGGGSENNWSHFLSLLPTSGEHKVFIEKLKIENLRFEIKRPNGKGVTIPAIDHLEFENLGGESPLTVSQIVRIVFQTILSTLRDKPFLSNILDHVSPLPESLTKGSNALKLYKEEVKNVFSEKFDAIKRKTQEATDFLQELFSK